MERDRLEQALAAVAGGDDLGLIRKALAEPRVLSLGRGNFSLTSFLRPICGLINSSLERPEQLALLGVEAMVYRTVAMQLRPERLLADSGRAGRPGERGPLDRACDHILAHLFSPIRLDALEAVSGLKARALQLAFQKHLGRTPRQWILDRRLDAARNVVSRPQPAAICPSCGGCTKAHPSRCAFRAGGLT